MPDRQDRPDEAILPSGGRTTHLEDRAMATRKRKRARLGLPKKTYWHLYSLQNLQSEKLAIVVNKILRHEYVLIK